MDTVLYVLALFGGAWVGFANRKLIFLSGEDIGSLLSKAVPMILGWCAVLVAVGALAAIVGLQNLILVLVLLSALGCGLSYLLTGN